MDVKPTPEQLTNFYQSNRSYFDQLANYYFENDRDYYNEFISPLLISLQPGEIYCPYCHKKTSLIRNSVTPTSSVLMILAGIFIGILGFLMITADFSCSIIILFIAFILFLMGISKKDIFSSCQHCKLKIG